MVVVGLGKVVVVGLGKAIVVGEELEIVSVRWRRVGVLLLFVLCCVILAPERRRGRQLGSC